MKDKWNALTKNPRWWAVSLFSLLLLSSVVVAAVHLSAYFRESETVTFSGRHHLDFRVFYLENNFFEDNPVPRNLDFLMSYTDFIEIESMFVVSSSYETDINYSRHAEKRLIIRHLGSVAGSFVFEQIIQMTPTIGATFTIFPKDYINIYFEFVEDQIRQMYAEDKKIADIYTIFTFIAIFISALGLFSMSLFDIQQRRKEIAIRKVNGATFNDVIRLLLKKYFLSLTISFVVATPVALFAIHRYLEGFANKATVSWWLFVVALVVTTGISLLTLIYQTVRAAGQNPAEIVKSE